MAWLHAFAPAERVQAAYSRIDTLARGLGADDQRSMDERRADVLFDLILGTRQDSVVTHVYVTLTAETLLGLDSLPGQLRGYGPLPAERIRELAFDLKSVWSGVLVDNGGYPKKIAEDRYRFSGRLAEYIRLRDGTCTYPACTRPADKADIDHIIPYPRGQTTDTDNAATECRRHHRLKTHTAWAVCPASRSWQDFRGLKCRDEWAGQAQVHLLWPVPGDGLVGSDLVVLASVVLGPFGEHEGVVDLVDVEPLVLQRAEPAFA